MKKRHLEPGPIVNRRSDQIAHLQYMLQREREGRQKEQAYIMELIADKKFLMTVLEKERAKHENN